MSVTSAPDLNPMKQSMDFLGTTLTTAEKKHSEFADACDKAIDNIKPSVETCVSKTRECYRIWPYVLITLLVAIFCIMVGIYLALTVIMSTIMLAIMTGIIAVIILGSSSVLVFALMEGYHNITSAKRLKTSFTKYGKKLDSLLENACTMKMRMARIHTTIKRFAAQRDSIIRAIEAEDTT